jgi:hypothetical protein
MVSCISSSSLLKRVSTSPPQSLQARYFSTSHAASPAGESLIPTASDWGRVDCWWA